MGGGDAWMEEKFTDVTSIYGYTLKNKEGANASDDLSSLEIDFVYENITSRKIYIKLGGKIATTHQAVAPGNSNPTLPTGSIWDEATWGPGSATSAAGRYAGVYIDKLFGSKELTNVAIKQTNEAFGFYMGAGLLEEKPTGPAQPDQPNIYLPEPPDLPVKWKLYSSIPATPFGILLWDRATVKTATLIVDQYDGVAADSKKTSDIATIIVDWSAVTWADK
jgi:hypothetical protein